VKYELLTDLRESTMRPIDCLPYSCTFDCRLATRADKRDTQSSRQPNSSYCSWEPSGSKIQSGVKRYTLEHYIAASKCPFPRPFSLRIIEVLDLERNISLKEIYLYNTVQ
jgi:hypothetical protein